MGSFQPAAIVDAEAIPATLVPAEDVAAWLDALLAHLASETIGPWHAEEIRQQLKSVPFGAILAAIDRGRPNLADPTVIRLYQEWIEANDGLSPTLYAAWFNLGVTLARTGHQPEATAAYAKALALRPTLHCAAINLGLSLEAQGQTEHALATWRQATQQDEARVALAIQQGRVLEKLGRLEEAERVLRRVLLLDTAQPDVIHHWLHIRQKMCLWPVAPTAIPGIPAAELLRRSGPLGILALTDDIDLQRDAAAAWLALKTEPAPSRLSPAQPYRHQRIRIGYLSADFCSHAMSYLVTELFERHDRDRFEVFGYCASPDDSSQLRERVLAAFDHRRFVRAMSDEQAAQIIRNDEIDVLIELNGITAGSRLPILRWRPAPIQATWLGFVGPVPMPELDYLLCDDVVIPPEHQASYQPKPLSIGRFFQANDSKRSTGRALTRDEAGLPRDRFVLCCFSRHYKITEAMFAAWMSILHQLDHAVLWLTKDNPYSQANLLAAASRAGIAADRVIFCERADPDTYLSRLAAADLYLDTFPYNAGTVASDAIRVGLPLVTLCGRAFASRMAASLLHSIGTRQGITTTLPKYIETVVRLGNDPAAYAQYKAQVAAPGWSRTIGDIARFTAEFEDTWCRLVRHRANTRVPATAE